MWCIIGFILKILGFAALVGYVGWMLRIMWRLITKPEDSGTLPWL